MYYIVLIIKGGNYPPYMNIYLIINIFLCDKVEYAYYKKQNVENK